MTVRTISTPADNHASILQDSASSPSAKVRGALLLWHGGLSLAGLAELLKIHRPSLVNELNGCKRSKRIRRAVSTYLDVPEAAIWGEGERPGKLRAKNGMKQA